MAAYKATVTITIATPAVVTWTAHGLANGTPIAFETTGALPTGLVVMGEVDSCYYVANATTDTFNVTNKDANGVDVIINTSGTQSGAHTCMASTGVLATSNEVSVSFTSGAAADVTWTAHPFQVNDQVVFWAPAGTMPGGVFPGTHYFVHAVVDVNTFKIKQTKAGGSVTTSSTGSSVIGYRADELSFADEKVVLSNVTLPADINLSGMVANSRWRVAEDSTNVEIASGVTTTGSATMKTKFRGLIRVDVRKASGAPKYLPYVGYGVVTNDPLSIYVSQVADTVA